MPKLMKVRCTGPGKHVHEIDLEKVLQKVIVYRAIENPTFPSGDELPERIVLPCPDGSGGQIIITREMIEDFLKRSSKE